MSEVTLLSPRVVPRAVPTPDPIGVTYLKTRYKTNCNKRRIHYINSDLNFGTLMSESAASRSCLFQLALRSGILISRDALNPNIGLKHNICPSWIELRERAQRTIRYYSIVSSVLQLFKSSELVQTLSTSTPGLLSPTITAIPPLVPVRVEPV